MVSDVETNSSPELFLEGRGNTFNRDQPGRLEMEKLIGRLEQFEKKIRDNLVFHDATLKTELQSITEELFNLKTKIQSVSEEQLNTRTELESATDEQFQVSVYLKELKERKTTKTEELQSVSDELLKLDAKIQSVSEEHKKILDERFFMNILISVMIISLPLKLSFVQSIDAADHLNHLQERWIRPIKTFIFRMKTCTFTVGIRPNTDQNLHFPNEKWPFLELKSSWDQMLKLIQVRSYSWKAEEIHSIAINPED